MDIKISFILDNILYSHDDNKVESLATYNQLHSDHCPLELETKAHPKVRNYGEGPY